MNDDFASWRAALAGEKVGIHDGEPWCGYFRMRDRRGLNKDLPAAQRPWVACAIWRGEDGELQAELAGRPLPPDHLWPYAAKYPIPYETYQHWHSTERWPEEAA